MGNCCIEPPLSPSSVRVQFINIYGEAADSFLDACISPICSPNRKAKRAQVVQEVSRSARPIDLSPPNYYSDPLLHFSIETAQPRRVLSCDRERQNHREKLLMMRNNHTDNNPLQANNRAVQALLLANRHFDLIEIPKRSKLFTLIEKSFKETSGGRHYEIRSVKRVENNNLWPRYALARFKMEKMIELGLHKPCDPISPPILPGLMDWAQEEIELKKSCNECLLFHGTRPNSVPLICEEGLDCIKYGSKTCCFGKGLYFAQNASKSEGYAPMDTTNGDGKSCYMFMCRVLLGNPYYCAPGHLLQYSFRPPCIEGHVSSVAKENHDALTTKQLRDLPSCDQHRVADSVIGNNPREFIVYENDRVYPELLVEFARA